MRHGRFWIPPLICGLLLAGCAPEKENSGKSAGKDEESKSQMEKVEEIMRASADGTRKVFSEMFHKKED